MFKKVIRVESSIILHFKEIDQKSWTDLEQLFESRGGPKFCWCMVWRATPEESKQTNPHWKKDALKRRVDEGIPVGILGYSGEEPVAWCSIAPRTSYLRLKGIEEVFDENVWSLVCFFIVRKYRGQGITRQLINAAVETARQKGATIVEAYPVNPDSPSYRFMGFVNSFKSAGFEDVGNAGIRRHIMRIRVR
jgi:GNAT superfamily N-acetyltransferase